MKKIVCVLIAIVAVVILVKLVTGLFIKDKFNDNADEAIENWKIEQSDVKIENVVSIDEYVTVEEAVPADDSVEYRIIN